jgi:hypothetical protein
MRKSGRPDLRGDLVHAVSPCARLCPPYGLRARRNPALALAAAVAVPMAAAASAAQSYPARPIRVIVPYTSKLGFDPMTGLPRAFAAFIAAEIPRWAAIVKSASATSQ